MALAPWGALGSGQFKSAEEYAAKDREGRQAGPQLGNFRRVGEKLDELAKKKNTVITSVALAYVMHKVCDHTDDKKPQSLIHSLGSICVSNRWRT